MKRIVLLMAVAVTAIAMSSCNKQTRLEKRLYKAGEWKADVTVDIVDPMGNTVTSKSVGIMTIKDDKTGTSVLSTDGGANVTENFTWEVNSDGTQVTVKEANGNVLTHQVNVNERKRQEWTTSTTIPGGQGGSTLPVSIKTVLTR